MEYPAKGRLTMRVFLAAAIAFGLMGWIVATLPEKPSTRDARCTVPVYCLVVSYLGD
jgi:hypothetical protein